VQAGTEVKRTLLSSTIRRKIPLKDLHWVVEHPERLSKRFLEQIESQEGILFSISGRRKTKSPKGFECC
jgi:hypothetical protein